MVNPFHPQRTHPRALALPQPGVSRPMAPVALDTVDAVGFVDWDVKGDRLTWDRGAEERFGATRGSLATFEGWASFVDPDDVARIQADIAGVVERAAERMAYRYRFRRPDGEWRLFEGLALCWFDEHFELARMTGVVLDITRSEAARSALEHSEAQLRTIIDTVPDAMLIIDGRGAIRKFSSAAERMFGYGAADVIGAPIDLLVPTATERLAAGRVDKYLGGGPSNVMGRDCPVEARRADGSLFPVELSVGQAALDNDRIFTCFIRDISDRVEATARFEALRSQYLRTARLNAMGMVAAGLAHELNQPLAASANFIAAARLSLDHGKSGDDLAAMLDQAGAQIALAGDIIRRLRGFLIPGDQAGERLQLPKLVEEAVALAFAGRPRPTISIDPADATALPDLRGNRVQMLQLLVNLLRNADDAMAGVAAREIVVSAALLGDLVEIAVVDIGPGFPPDLLDTVGKTIVTTKGADGMGFGLTICRRIVESWGGRLHCANRAEGGARVAFTVPRALDESRG